MGAIVVLTTTGSAESADTLARHVVSVGLAGCVQTTQISSTYRWDGDVVVDPEFLLLIKTTTDRAEQLRRRILELHDYDTPEILELPVIGGNDAYLAWLDDATR